MQGVDGGGEGYGRSGKLNLESSDCEDGTIGGGGGGLGCGLKEKKA